MSKKRVVRIGIVGCGGIANGKHLPTLSKFDEVELVAFCDLVEERAEAARAQYGTADSKVYVDYRQLLADPSIEVVHVLTPNISHSEIAIAAMEAGKHVMSEKPMAKTAAMARAMVEAAGRTGRKLTVGYDNRFRADSQMLYRLCRRGDLGEIYYARALAVRRRMVPTWGVFLDEDKQGGGPLIDIGTHALDLTLWLMDNYRPKMVVGTTYHKLSSQANAANAWGSWDPAKFTVEDSAMGFVVMEDGASVAIESSWALNTRLVDEAKAVLCGTRAGADMLDGLHVNGEDLSQLYVKNVDLPKSKEGWGPTLEMRTWLDSIIHDTELVVKPEQALVVSEIIEGLYQSAKTGQPYLFESKKVG